MISFFSGNNIFKSGKGGKKRYLESSLPVVFSNAVILAGSSVQAVTHSCDGSEQRAGEPVAHSDGQLDRLDGEDGPCQEALTCIRSFRRWKVIALFIHPSIHQMKYLQTTPNISVMLNSIYMNDFCFYSTHFNTAVFTHVLTKNTYFASVIKDMLLCLVHSVFLGVSSLLTQLCSSLMLTHKCRRHCWGMGGSLQFNIRGLNVSASPLLMEAPGGLG